MPGIRYPLVTEPWEEVAGCSRYGPALAALEFTRSGEAERVRITGDGGGFSVWLDCAA